MSLLRSHWHDVKSALTAAKLGVRLVKEELDHSENAINRSELFTFVTQVEDRLEKCASHLKILEAEVKGKIPA